MNRYLLIIEDFCGGCWISIPPPTVFVFDANDDDAAAEIAVSYLMPKS